MVDYTPHKLNTLRLEFGCNKEIPKKYEALILTALSYYPELKEAAIKFQLKQKHRVPYSTRPTFGSILTSPRKRKYIVSILEEADSPMFRALFKNLPLDAQLGAIGHELVHVIQFNACSRLQLMKMLLLYFKPSFHREIERAADMGTIIHGLGCELYEHAVYIRNIPGYAEERKEIEKNHLKPVEIIQVLKDRKFIT